MSTVFFSGPVVKSETTYNEINTYSLSDEHRVEFG